MRPEYAKILDEMVINKNVINQYTDGTRLLSYLLIHDVINPDRKKQMDSKGPEESIQVNL